MKYRLLIVEDTPKLAEEYADSLASHFDCRIATRADEVFSQILAFDPQAVLLDITLEGEKNLDPIDAGIRILSEIRSFRPPFREMPVIVATGRIEEWVKKKCEDLGVVDFFLKPASIREIRASLLIAMDKLAMPANQLKVFISSNMAEFQVERLLAKQVIEEVNPNCSVELAENWQASPEPVKSIWKHAVEACDILVLLIGEKYGTPLPSNNISPLEDEYNNAKKNNKKILVFAKDISRRDPRLEALFVGKLRDPENGHLVKFFSTPEELKYHLKSTFVNIK